nr:MAG TPA: hypothetical protein [Caudoviricetes sp.]DAI22025.1 MAG TPA: hypothetical protein [Caudoviricetes sp.]DAN31882.1 MAG TPA: hypothetical protein [Caudoviricetes sp.]DAZ82773.1 MAG TPA: hypothetical protein [Caudoviricetes sp.]
MHGRNSRTNEPMSLLRSLGNRANAIGSFYFFGL